MFHELLLLEHEVFVLGQHLFLKFGAFSRQSLLRLLLLLKHLNLQLIHPALLLELGQLGLVLQLHLPLLQLRLLKLKLLLGDPLVSRPLLFFLSLSLSGCCICGYFCLFLGPDLGRFGGFTFLRGRCLHRRLLLLTDLDSHGLLLLGRRSDVCRRSSRQRVHGVVGIVVDSGCCTSDAQRLERLDQV